MKCKHCKALVTTRGKGDSVYGECPNGHAFIREAKPPSEPRRNYPWHGELLSARKIAIQLGLPVSKFKFNLKLGMEVDEAIEASRSSA